MYTIDTPLTSEYPLLLTIWEDSVRATHHFLQEGDIGFFKQVIQEHRVFELVQLLTVRNTEHQPLGFMGVANENLEMLFLTPNALHKGIGTMMVQYAIKHLGVTKVDVNEQNENALRFYEKVGFRVISRSPLDGTGKPYPILHMELNKTHTTM
ncbi:MAG: GNAT family N-acetyltransferase [Spirosomataceae bacterium]